MSLGTLPMADRAVIESVKGDSTETILQCYTQADEAIMLAVVSETRKLWAVGCQTITETVAARRRHYGAGLSNFLSFDHFT